MPRKSVTVDNSQKIQAVVDRYFQTIEEYCTARKIPLERMAMRLQKRPQAVRVAKVASFEVRKGNQVKRVGDVFENDDIYLITNKVYNRLMASTEVDVTSVEDAGLFDIL